MHRHGIQSPGQRGREESWSRRIGPVGMEEEIELDRTAVKQGKGVRMVGDHVNGYTQYVKLEGWQVSAWDTPASTGVSVSCRTLSPTRKWTSFSMPPFSYFKPRGVLESTVSVWTEWGNWIGNKASAASDAVGSAHESGERQVGQTVDTTTKAAKDASAEAPSRAAPMRWSRLPSVKSNKPSSVRCKRQRKHAPQPNAPTMLPQKSPAMRLTPRSAVRTI